jgi:hypothetical protein
MGVKGQKEVVDMLTPFRGFWDMQSEVDRMFNDMVRDVFGRRREGVGAQQL